MPVSELKPINIYSLGMKNSSQKISIKIDFGISENVSIA
jgi:hypothetical protein